ncbi:MAG: TolC family protein [Pirellulales bacterium]|nr:TolC family protein [Pirellulales bacterium]
MAGQTQQANTTIKSEIRRVEFASPDAEQIAAPRVAPFDQSPALEVEPLVEEVVARNPDVRSAVAAWRAAAARYPQEVALDDPMFGTMLGPASWDSADVDSAYALEASQKLPWPGKRDLRGNMAQAQANAAFHDVGEERLRIAEAARIAYYEYFLAHRQLAVLKKSYELLLSFSEIAKSKYESASVEQQDVLLADVELAELERRNLEITRRVRVAQARINTLLLLPPEAPLPPPPAILPVHDVVPEAEELRAVALSQRPELAAQAARIRAERYAVALACKEFYPDMEVVARYDAFWQTPEEDLRPMVGMNINVPIYKQKRWAAVREARARVSQQQAELDSRMSEIAFEVEQAYQRVEESRKSLAVYKDRLLPIAGQSIEAARAGYVAGNLDFLRLVESQRQSLMLQDRYYEAIAQYHQRVAELDRVVGTLTSPMTTQNPWYSLKVCPPTSPVSNARSLPP